MPNKSGRKEIRLNGKMITALDPALIGENYQSLKNIRYTSDNLEGVRGMTKINSTAIPTYPKVRSVYQFTKNQAPEDHLLVQAYNTGLSASQVLEHTIAIPGTGDFSATPLWTDGIGASRGRFSKAASGHVAYCNSVESCIWGGNEFTVGAFLNFDPDGSFMYDATEQVNNTINDSLNRITVSNSGGGIDNNTVLLLHLDNNVTDATSKHTVTNTGVTFSTTYKVFGTHGAVFDGTTDKFEIANHADFDFSGGSFCIDGRFRFVSLTTNNVIYYHATDASNYSKLYVDTNGAVIFSVYASGTEKVNIATPPGTIAVNTWYHIEIDENGDDYIIFIDGTNKAQISNTDRPANYTGTVYIGTDTSTYLHAYVDEIRISNTYRHISNFSKPLIAYSNSSASSYFYIGSSRPLRGFKVYLDTVNTKASTMQVYYWGNGDWVEVSNISDGTLSGGVSCAQTGSVTFDSTVSSAQLREMEGYILYFYKVYVSSIDNSTTIYHITLDAPFQKIRDVWDGVEREIMSFMVTKNSTGKSFYDYTIKVQKEDFSPGTNYDGTTYLDGSTYAKLNSFAYTQFFIAGFTERMMGVTFNIVPEYHNTTASTICSVYYWNGSNWVSVGNINDGTAPEGISFSQSGTISWAPISKNNEFKYVVGKDVPLYYYKFQFSKTFSSRVFLDCVTGIAAPKTINGYKFPIYAQNRLMLCSEYNKAKNSVLCSAKDQPNVFNGEDSSELFFGDDTELTAGIELFSQFGGSLYDLVLFFKSNEMWVLAGDSPENWKIFKVSEVIGCPAPQTLTLINIPVEFIPGMNRNLAIWQGADGIYVSDGRAPIPVHFDIENYFDKSKDECIKASMIGDSVGFYDPNKMEYHWLFASGTSATSLNKELVLNIRFMKWYEIDRGSGKYLQYGINVNDRYGNSYNYGFLDTGYMERLEYGTDFDGTDITYELWTGDIAPYNGTIWHKTKLRHIILDMIAKTTTTNSVTVTHYGDSSTTGTSFTLSPVSSGKRLALTSKSHSLGDHVFHSLKFNMITNNETVGFEPLFLAMDYDIVRDAA